MKNLRKVIHILVLSVSMFLVLFGLSTVEVKAVESYRDSDIYDMAPDSLNISLTTTDPNALFMPGKYTSGFGPVISNGKRLDFPLGGNATAITSAWSNVDNNYLNINQRQNISVWIYMGDSNSAAEGVTFVLQNGDDPISSSTANNVGKIGGGETIGTWGCGLASSVRSPETMAARAIQHSWALEFDTMVNGSTTIGSSTKGDSLDGYQVNDGGGRGIRTQHVGWAYPGDPLSYTKDGGNNWYILNHNDTSELDTRTNSEKRLAWHHLAITYIPPEKGSNIASLTYKINDKDIKGIDFNSWDRVPFAQGEVGATIPLALDKFELKSDRLRFGFMTVGAAASSFKGANASVLFETLPGVIQADTNAYIINKTNQTKIIESDPHKTNNNHPDMFDGSDESLPTATRAHPKDELQFKYLLNFVSGRSNIDNSTVKISLPDGIDFETDPTKQIGEIDYGGGNKQIIYGQTPSTGSDSNHNEFKEITVNLDRNLDLTTCQAVISINGVAADLPAGTETVKVPPSHAGVSTDQYYADLETKPFTVYYPDDTLTLTKTSKDPQVLYNQNETTVTGHWDFDKLATATNEDTEIHYSIDGADEIVTKDTISKMGDFELYLSNLSKKEHKIKVYVVNHNYPLEYDKDGKVTEVDTFVSNTVTYTVTVEDKALRIDSKSDQELIATGNMDVGIDGTHSYNDSSSFKNDDLTLHTVVNGIDTTTQLSGSDAITSGDFSANIKAANLKVGDNPVKLYMTDSHDLKSNELEFNVNVPDTTLTLIPDLTDITALYTEVARLGGTINYSDNAAFKNSDITLNITIDNDEPYMYELTGDDSATTNKFVYEKSGGELGVGDHTVVITATDGYGRSSTPVTYNVTIINKSLKLKSDKGYSFKSINASPETRILPRSGDWTLEVESINTKWLLSAQCTELTDTTNDRNLAGGLIYTNKDGAIQSLEDSQVLLASDDTVGQEKEVTDIVGQWSKDNGILLKVMPSPLAGSYTGTISWHLTDSVQ